MAIAARNPFIGSRPVCRAAKKCAPTVVHALPSATEAAARAASITASMILVASLASPAHALSGGGKSLGIAKPLDGEDLSNRDLTSIAFTKGSARETNFSGSNLRGTSLFGVEAIGAKFVGADLSGATLELGNFESADFTDAVLEGAFVQAAAFKGAKLTNSDWTDVLLRKDQLTALCSNKTATGVNPKTGVVTRESLNCP